MVKSCLVFVIAASILLEVAGPERSPGNSDGSRILAVAQKMITVIENVEDFTCEAEVIYYSDGEEDQRYRITFFYKKNGKIRVKFSRPYPGLTVFYEYGDQELTVKPFKYLPVVKLRFSINNSMVKTPSGQRINQTDVQYFIRFLLENVDWVLKKENEFYEKEDQIEFMFYAKDYIEGKELEKYRVFVSKNTWFPVRIERYNLQDTPLEVMTFKNHSINQHLKEEFFNP
jgi:outer membrane lipoprotein-sorting protein